MLKNYWSGEVVQVFIILNVELIRNFFSYVVLHLCAQIHIKAIKKPFCRIKRYSISSFQIHKQILIFVLSTRTRKSTYNHKYMEHVAALAQNNSSHQDYCNIYAWHTKAIFCVNGTLHHQLNKVEYLK